MDESKEDQRLPRRCNPNEPVSLDHLAGQFRFFLSLIIIIVFFFLSSGFCFCFWLNGNGQCWEMAELGVLYWHLNPKDYENDDELKKIRESRGYNYMVFLFLICVFILFYFLLLRLKSLLTFCLSSLLTEVYLCCMLCLVLYVIVWILSHPDMNIFRFWLAKRGIPNPIF